MTRGLSLYLDLLRALAALVVLLTHLAYSDISGGMLQPWRLFGNDAVMVFFVLSGFVIAYVGEDKEQTLRDYSLSRLARLWSVAVPALLITILLDQAGRAMNPIAYQSWWYAGDDPLFRLVAALTFTNELWFGSTRVFSNGPYWSLGYEFWYYALFGAATFLTGTKRRIALITLALIAGPKILLLFPIWWMGVLAYRHSRQSETPLPLAWALFLGSILAYAAFRWSGLPLDLLAATKAALGPSWTYLAFSDEFLSSYIIGPLVMAHFVGAHALSRHLGAALAPVATFVRAAARYSFTLYLLHYPVLRFLSSVPGYDPNSPLQVGLLLAATIAFCTIVGMAVEKRKDGLRRRLDALLPSRASALVVRSA